MPNTRRDNTLSPRGLVDAVFDLFIDDFGTGNSSLGWLKSLPASTRKIDRLFVDEKSPEDFEYLVNIIALVRSRNKRVVLEGIGTEQQYELLKRLDADGLQGFHFSKLFLRHELGSGLRKNSSCL